MSIGIYDNDMANYVPITFNLEVMKLSSYFKNKNQIVVLARSFTPEKNQKFFVRKDYDDGKFPQGLYKYKNVNYGGLAFTNNIYIPLPKEIEESRPDTSIYSKMEKVFQLYGDNKTKRIFMTQMEAEHGRLSLDGRSIWDNYMKQFKFLPSARNLILHDYNLAAIDNSFEEIKVLLSKARTDGWATKIGMKFPVQISSGKELLNWSSLNPDRTFYSIKYNGIVDNKSWYEYIAQCRRRAVYFNLEYWITNGDTTEDELGSNGLRKILRQVILSRSRKIHFLLKYMDTFFSDKRWERVIQLFQFYLNSFTNIRYATYFKVLPTDTVYDFAKHLMDKPYKTYGPESISKQQAREIFAFIREKNPKLFEDLYRCNFNTILEEDNDWY